MTRQNLHPDVSLDCDLVGWKSSTPYWCFRVVTYIAEMPQWLPAFTPAESYSDRPMSDTVGAMVKGPMKRMRKPMRPEKPTKTWRREATIIEPCSCGQEHSVQEHQYQCHRAFFGWVIDLNNEYNLLLPGVQTTCVHWINHELCRSAVMFLLACF